MRKLMIFLFLVIIISCKKEDDNNSYFVIKPNVEIYLDSIQQVIRGFGGASIREWIPDLTDYQRKLAFSVDEGLGLSVLRVRVPVDSTKFILEKSTVDAAKNYGVLVIATAWTPPAYMKNNNNIVGGKLLVEKYSEYAKHLRRFCEVVGGVYAISPFNEPNIVVNYESVNMTAQEVAAFVASEGENLGAPVMAPEPYDMNKKYFDDYLKDTVAKRKTKYLCGHIYGVKPYKYICDKEIWMTEHYTDTINPNNWSGALKVAKEIHECMVSNYSMYVWWYIRRFYGLITDDNKITKRGYILSHFSKFIRPGSYKVKSTENPLEKVYLTAYRNENKLIIVVINENYNPTRLIIKINGLNFMKFKAYQTTENENYKITEIHSSSNQIDYKFLPLSITTLVSD